MLIRKAKKEEYKTITRYLLLAMEELVYNSIGKNSKVKATQLIESLVQEENNQYSYENCWVVEVDNKIVAATNVYDGAKLEKLRRPVMKRIKEMFNREYSPADETDATEFYIDCVGVNPNQQGKGIGSRLFKFLINKYAKRDNETLGLLVDLENPKAKKLYQRLGFKVVGKKRLDGKVLEHMQFEFA